MKIDLDDLRKKYIAYGYPAYTSLYELRKFENDLKEREL